MADATGSGGDGLAEVRTDLAELSSLLGAVLFDNADGILVLDADGVILTVNPAAEVLLGQLAGSLVGQPFGRPVASHETSELDLVGPTRRVAEMRASPTRLQGEQVTVATLRDVTDRLEAEESLRNFVSMASHEFRTPITSILGFSETIHDSWDVLDDEAKLRYLEVILRQSRRLSRLSTDLLSLSRLEEGRGALQRRRVDVRAVVLRAVESFTDVVDGVTPSHIEVDVEEGLWAMADEDHVEEMLVNYLGNAVKYGAPPIVVRAARADDDVRIEVVDHGEGVPADFRPKLFQRFARDRRTARREEGTGLGLSIVAALARRNDGEAWYRPGEPTGSTFGITLPGA